LNGIAAIPCNLLRDCAATFNGVDGINAGAGSLIHDCVAESNMSNGVQVVTGIGIPLVVPTDLRGIRSFANGLNGILIGLSQGTVQNCSVIGNKADGIRAPSLFTVVGNELRGNGQGQSGGNGLSLTGSNNIVFGNRSLKNNGKNFDIAPGNDAGPVGSAAASTSPFGNLQLTP
jgi:hypothetical protein